MKTITIIKYTFTIIGSVLTAIAILGYVNTQSFLETSTVAQGTVVDLVMTKSDRSSSSSGVSIRTTSNSYAPIVEFMADNGRTYSFTSSVSTSPPAYSIGEKVEILYDESDPNEALINSFFFVWGGVLILGGLGFLFATVGLTMFAIGLFKGRNKQRLMETGVRITTRFHSTQLNPGLAVNGRNPYQIRSEWKNPRTAQMHIFDSDNIWFDPTDHIPDEITVYIEHDNPKKYYVDLSFLPAS